MSQNQFETCDIKSWVDQEQIPARRELRQAVHTVLYTISQSPVLTPQMIMKGGILIALKYHGSRFTKDIDFSTEDNFHDFDQEGFLSEFKRGLASAVEDLDYAIDCRLQSHEVRPKGEDKHFQTLMLRIGFAEKGSRKHKLLLRNNCPDILEIDYSFNEITQEKEVLQLSDSDNNIEVYSFIDLVAEKLRAILQQEVRNRARRQDAYDLYFLLNQHSCNQNEILKILESLKIKSTSRNLPIDKYSLSDERIKGRSRKEYSQLKDEIEEPLPPFKEVYGFVEDFYKSLPWDH